MREYDTWEVIKMLSEKPEMKFEDVSVIGAKPSPCQTVSSNMVGMTSEGILCWIYPDGGTCTLFSINHNTINKKWQLVRTPLTWQEALQAWAKGKTVRCECSDCLNECKDAPYRCILGNSFGAMCPKGIKTGTWYIEDGDPNE